MEKQNIAFVPICYIWYVEHVQQIDSRKTVVTLAWLLSCPLTSNSVGVIP